MKASYIENVNVQQTEGLSGQVHGQAQTVQSIVGEAMKPQTTSFSNGIGNNNNARFSIFGYGYRNKQGQAVLQTKPAGTTDILSVFQYITSPAAKAAQDTLRAMRGRADKAECSDYKKLNFRFVTFRGIFAERKASSLSLLSDYMVVDIDELSSAEEARRLIRLLSDDTHFETALAFVSPGGMGVKWVVEIPNWLQEMGYKEQYLFACRHVMLQYGVEPDWGCSDVCRACFLGHDKDCFINPKFIM